MHMSTPLPQGVSISGRISPEFTQILTPEALAFVAKLHRQFEPRRQELLARRDAVPDTLDEVPHLGLVPVSERLLGQRACPAHVEIGLLDDIAARSAGEGADGRVTGDRK